MSTDESKVFQKNYYNLQQQMLQCHDSVGSLLLQNGLIPSDILQITDRSEKVSRIMQALHAKVKTEPEAFYDILEVLSKVGYFKHLCATLEHECECLKTGKTANYDFLTPPMQPSSNSEQKEFPEIHSPSADQTYQHNDSGVVTTPQNSRQLAIVADSVMNNLTVFTRQLGIHQPSDSSFQEYARSQLAPTSLPTSATEFVKPVNAGQASPVAKHHSPKSVSNEETMSSFEHKFQSKLVIAQQVGHVNDGCQLCADKDDHIHSLKSDIQYHEATAAIDRSYLQDKVRENERLRSQLQHARNRNKQLEDVNKKFEDKLKQNLVYGYQLQDRVRLLESALNHEKEEKEGLLKQLGELMSCKQAMAATHLQQTDEIENLKQQIADMSQRIDKLEGDLYELNTTLLYERQEKNELFEEENELSLGYVTPDD